MSILGTTPMLRKAERTIAPNSYAMGAMVKFTVFANGESKTLYKFAEAMKAAKEVYDLGVLDAFTLERDGAFWEFNFERNLFEFESLVNPEVQPKNHRVTFEDDEGHAVMAQPVTWYEAERLVRRFCGCEVYEIGNHIPVYIDPIPDYDPSELFE